MGAIKVLLIIATILVSFTAVSSLKISFNTTHPLQFKGVESFENLDDVRVIFRVEPISIRAGESANLTFRVENPTVDVHRVRVSLIDVPPGFSVVSGGHMIEKDVSGNSSEPIVFTLKASADIASRSYFYAFDIFDETLASDGESALNLSKLLGTYHGINIVDSEEPGKEGEMIDPQTSEPSYIPIIALIILASLLILALKGRTKR